MGRYIKAGAVAENVVGAGSAYVLKRIDKGIENGVNGAKQERDKDEGDCADDLTPKLSAGSPELIRHLENR